MIQKRSNPNRDAAMRRAYIYARSGNRRWTQIFIDRANSFASISPAQLKRAQDYLNQAIASTIQNA